MSLYLVTSNLEGEAIAVNRKQSPLGLCEHFYKHLASNQPLPSILILPVYQNSVSKLGIY